MVCRKEEIDAYLAGKHLIQSADPHLRMRATLSLVRYRTSSDWIFYLKGNLSRSQTRDWLLSKKLSRQRLSKSEQLVLFLLLGKEEDWKALETVSSLSDSTLTSFLPLAELEKRLNDLYNIAGGILGKGPPRVVLHRTFSPNRVKEPARIGVGYRDKGSISSVPRLEPLDTEEEISDKLNSTLVSAITSFSGCLL
jgi:hypothetical protein